jgi:surfeit locus 1 family protein
MALPSFDLRGAADGVEQFRSVKAAGSFDYARQIVIDARLMDGVPAVIVVTPLELGNGSAVLVERGWVPSPDAHTVDLRPLQESDSVTVIGTVLATGPETPSPADSGWPKHVQRPSPRSLAGLYPYRLLPFVVLRTATAAATVLRPVAPPELTDGPHLSYTIQWFSFAVIMLVGSVFLYTERKR